MRLLGRRGPPPPSAARCGSCLHFEAGPRALGRIPGLQVLSSARASVTDEDGLCTRWGRFTGARDGCAAFCAATPLPSG